MDKSFLISVTTALALGYGAGFATNGFEAQAASPLEQSVSVDITLTTAQANALAGIVQNKACPEFDTKMGTSGASACNATKDLGHICFSPRVDPQTQVKEVVGNVVFKRAGTWVAAEPQ